MNFRLQEFSFGYVSQFGSVIGRVSSSLATGSSLLSRCRKVEFVFYQRATCFLHSIWTMIPQPKPPVLWSRAPPLILAPVHRSPQPLSYVSVVCLLSVTSAHTFLAIGQLQSAWATVSSCCWHTPQARSTGTFLRQRFTRVGSISEHASQAKFRTLGGMCTYHIRFQNFLSL